MESIARFVSLFVVLLLVVSCAQAQDIDPSQKDWHKRYQKQANAPDPAKQLFNDDPEPAFAGEGFVDLFNGKDLTGWVARGGKCTFEVKDGEIVGTCVKGSPSTYLSTERDDFGDFVATAELKWEVDGNTGVMFRAKVKNDGKKETVYGPQAEMEDEGKGRGWSGGIYGQSCGGYYYPVWLADKRHVAARAAQKRGEWNRITIQCEGEVMKTWLNGVPVSHVVNGEFMKGFFGLQVHSGSKGQIRFRNLRVKELKQKAKGKVGLHGVPLFDGKTLAGWRGYKMEGLPKSWEVRDGSIFCNGKDKTNLITEKKYTNFELTGEWKISKGGNSGILLRVAEVTPWASSSGLEIQVIDHADGWKEVNGSSIGLGQAAGALYAVYPSKNAAIKKAGEWNTVRVRIVGSKIQLHQNGVELVDADMESKDWKKRVAASKFKDSEHFNQHATGHIALQNYQGAGVWYRNLRIREIDTLK